MKTVFKLIASLPTSAFQDKELGIPIDISYVSNRTTTANNLIVSSYPTNSVKKVYRNSISDLVNFMNIKHGPSNWEIWNLKHMGQKHCDYASFIGSTNIIHYYGDWVDHEAPEFSLLLDALTTLYNYLESPGKTAVVHCNAGKGRSGSLCVCYLMKKYRLSLVDSMSIFTSCRISMPQVFGQGVSIKSQKRYLRYMEFYLNGGVEYPKNHMRVSIESVKIVKPAAFVYRNFDKVKIWIAYYQHSSKQACPTLKYEQISYPNFINFNENVIEFTSEHSVPLDVRLSFDITSLKGVSQSYVWFNGIFEAVLNTHGSTSHSNTHLFSCNWEEFDGVWGFPLLKGATVCESVEIRYRLTQ